MQIVFLLKSKYPWLFYFHLLSLLSKGYMTSGVKFVRIFAQQNVSVILVHCNLRKLWYILVGYKCLNVAVRSLYTHQLRVDA